MKKIAVLLMSGFFAFASSAASVGVCGGCHVVTGRQNAKSPEWNSNVKAATTFAIAPSSSDTCMTCHDGTAGPQVLRENNHPVGVTYALQTDRPASLRSPYSPSGLGGSIAEDLLVDGRVECISCHDQHTGHGEGKMMLRMTNEGSRLCLVCHDK